MSQEQPFSGSISKQYYIVEVVCGVTPTSPAWTQIRGTSGVPAVVKDALQSNELEGSREVIDIFTGNEQVNGEFAVELSHTSQDDLLESAMGAAFVTGGTDAALSITVLASAKTFTRSAGDFTSNTSVGDLVQFPDLAGNNADPFIVTAVTATVITGGGITKTLTDESTTSDFDRGDKLSVGSVLKTFSILTELNGNGGTTTQFLLTTGVQFTGFNYDIAVNAIVTGAFPFIGRAMTISGTAPSGSTFPAVGTTKPFTGVDGKVCDSGAVLAGITTINIANDNDASAQFELGDKSVEFVERGNASNTFSATAFMRDTDLLTKYVDETDVNISVVVNGPSGSMSFSLETARLTNVAPDIGGPASITQTIEGTGKGSSTQSSLIIQRLLP